MHVTLAYNDREVDLISGKYASFDELYVDSTYAPLDNNLQLPVYRLTLSIHPKQNVTLKRLRLKISKIYDQSTSIFCNGFHSGTESRGFGLQENFPRALVRPFLPEDMAFKPQRFYSWGFSYIRTGQGIDFIGSLSENTGYTLYEHHVAAQQLLIYKDCGQLQLGHSFPAFDLIFSVGPQPLVLSHFFARQRPSPSAFEDQPGALMVLPPSKRPGVDLTQNFWIEDFALHSGDWLNTKAEIIPMLREAGFRGQSSTIALTPFHCSADSALFKNKSHWLCKDPKGRPLKLRRSGETLYLLNFYEKEVQDYLTGVFFTMLNKWGVGQIAVRGLFQTGLQHLSGKTRGQVMYEALAFLRDNVGEDRLIVADVPLLSAFGLCRQLQLSYRPLPLPNWWHQLLKMADPVSNIWHWVRLSELLKGAYILYSPPVALHQSAPGWKENLQETQLLLARLLFHHPVWAAVPGTDGQGDPAVLSEYEKPEVRHIIYAGKPELTIEFEEGTTSYVALINLARKKVDMRYRQWSVALEAYESIVLKNHPSY